MTEFVNMWKNFANFSARTTRRGYWMAYLFIVIAAIVISILAAFTTDVLSYLFSLAILVPSISMFVRRMRDAGKGWWWIFIPIGNIIMACQPSIPEDGTPVV